MKTTFYWLLLLGVCLLSACSYDSEKALKNGDVINMHGPIYNFVYFEEFMERVEAEDSAFVRITNFTLEGNPTLYNVTFDGTVFNLEIDRSKNKERGDKPSKESLSCTELSREEGQQLFSYTLEGCKPDPSFTLLNILKEQEMDHEH
ncbi:DUF4362 domain-containing protein [Sporosarcina sp. Te-1]|uniref:DUF4362 domain-containing protein n=1 Tax=Sporosarcina sp. Te-1 TaxID=2818390 RepID=UPI001A9DB704|nr:DUF4362 domain-containing protein [Sporosarcina sp. Te-1]QTD43221.1 DUF4362 domain-containing protein [Sporosarcina sp. Te-1]